MTGNSAEDAALWQSLPELSGVVGVGAAKPGAVVLSRHPGHIAGGDERGAIVLATQSYGKGRVGLITADTTWRWSRLARLSGRPDTLYVRFWSQMVRWLAGRDPASQPRPLVIATDRADYKPGDKVSIDIRRNAAALVPGEAAGGTDLQVVVRGPGGAAMPLKPVASSADPDHWTVQYTPERAGRFTIEAALTAHERAVANETAEFSVRGSTLEIDNPATDPATLALIARLTGGFYADIDDPAAQSLWLDNLPNQSRVVYEDRSTRFWNNPLVLLAFIGLLTGEWFLRRRNRMV